MVDTNLLEAGQLDLYNEAYYEVLVENWRAPYIDSAEAAFGSMDDSRKVRLALMLENTRRALSGHFRHQGSSVQSLFEATQTSDVGPFVQYAFDLITAVMPNLIAERIVSVQPMKSSAGQIFYLKYQYGSDKGRISAGTDMLNPFTGSPGTEASAEYSSDDVSDEIIAAAGAEDINTILSWLPIVPGSVVITDGTTSWTDDGQGVLTEVGGSAAGTVNYATGGIVLTITAAEDTVYATYRYNNQHAPAQVPEVNLKVEQITVQARSRKLKALYAFDASYNLRMEQGIDIDSALLEAVSAEILHEIDSEILRDLYNSASTATTWDRTPPDGISWIDHKQGFIDHLTQLSNDIFAATRRAEGNFLVVGTNVAAILESLPSTVWSNVNGGRKSGPHYMGVLGGKWEVFKNPFYGANQYLVGYNGDVIMDAGFVYAPYLPIFATQLLMREDFTARRGFASSYGKKMVNPLMYIRGSIVTT